MRLLLGSRFRADHGQSGSYALGSAPGNAVAQVILMLKTRLTDIVTLVDMRGVICEG